MFISANDFLCLFGYERARTHLSFIRVLFLRYRFSFFGRGKATFVTVVSGPEYQAEVLRYRETYCGSLDLRDRSRFISRTARREERIAAVLEYITYISEARGI